VKISAAIDFVDKKVRELEQQLYVVDSVVIPRYEQDKIILKRMRDQKIKMQALQEKIELLNKRRAAGERIAPEEEITAVEMESALPEIFR